MRAPTRLGAAAGRRVARLLRGRPRLRPRAHVARHVLVRAVDTPPAEGAVPLACRLAAAPRAGRAVALQVPARRPVGLLTEQVPVGSAILVDLAPVPRADALVTRRVLVVPAGLCGDIALRPVDVLVTGLLSFTHDAQTRPVREEPPVGDGR